MRFFPPTSMAGIATCTSRVYDTAPPHLRASAIRNVLSGPRFFGGLNLSFHASERSAVFMPLRVCFGTNRVPSLGNCTSLSTCSSDSKRSASKLRGRRSRPLCGLHGTTRVFWYEPRPKFRELRPRDTRAAVIRNIGLRVHFRGLINAFSCLGVAREAKPSAVWSSRYESRPKFRERRSVIHVQL